MRKEGALIRSLFTKRLHFCSIMFEAIPPVFIFVKTGGNNGKKNLRLCGQLEF